MSTLVVVEPDVEGGVPSPTTVNSKLSSTPKEDSANEPRSCCRWVRILLIAGLTLALVAIVVALLVLCTRPKAKDERRTEPHRENHPVAPHYLDGRYAIVEQDGARIPAGGELSIYFVGGSNVAWQTWPDQLHGYLQRLEYTVAPQNYTHQDIAFKTEEAPICDDETEYSSLATPRIARPGWGSWGFAYDSMDDCVDAPLFGETTGVYPFRKIAGRDVSCLNGWACEPKKEQAHQMVRVSDIAEDAGMADVVMLSTWVNDFKQQYCKYKCYNGTYLEQSEIAPITIANIRRVIQAIHVVNPNTFVVVMALYSDAKKSLVVEDTLDEIAAINTLVEAGVAQEPNTAFVDFALAPGQDMFQITPAGHPNCRGDRLMATQVINKLFERRVLGRALSLPTGKNATECLNAASCRDIDDKVCCQAAASCRVDPAGACVDYSAGVGAL
eukprot:CAMPEP_0176104970 /NCGR_PEP_ID=MMETSP0120_2-20121206/52674_1 /TAXON_ID=160619 /ORGANISM="Kryptoperidinium foliaceum, Strain CCMP 1326" /LENGTH=441 /DNA_ID=CAMNT_0017439081 /DNA_START=51 /DNA_END=1376 /DNA_ORIENTATION=+